MSIINDITADNRVAMAVAAAIENAIGGDLILGVGRPRLEAPTADVLPAPPARVVRSAFTQGAAGGVYIALAEVLATRLEGAAGDGQLVTALAPAFDTAIATLQEIDAVQLAAPHDVSLDELLTESAFADREHAVYSLLDGDQRLGAFVVSAGAATASAAGDSSANEAQVATTAAPQAAPTAGGAPHVSVHQFQQLGDGGAGSTDPRSLSLLHDVEMGVTAELGRRRMTVRDLLALTPGSVIELDRTAGSPIDVLVNGTLIARGEVVVIDEEFGIRIAEIVGVQTATNPTTAANAA
ncbi:MAG TPA: flagellar motor switch protein FliN [Acidimicrobiia bacterium]|jgi:flagellar motor switch protein FliN